MKKLLENFTDTEIMAIQGATYFHRDLATRYCEGAEFADRHGNIYPAPLFRVNRDMYVEVWPKIKIGKTEINAPFSCKPEHGAAYWYFDGTFSNFSSHTWIDDSFGNSNLSAS